jgi:adenylate cyclase
LGRLRLISGLTLFFYILTHNINHALGLVSLAALEEGREIFLAFWRFPPVEWLLFLALLVHFALGTRALYTRHSLRMPFWEATQLVLGLSVPPLILLHILGTVVAHEVFGLDDAYDITLLAIFSSPVVLTTQIVAVLVTWIHGCIGLGYWLRIRPWFADSKPALFASALLIPTLALLGFGEAGRDVMQSAMDPDWVRTLVERRNLPDRASIAQLYHWLFVGLALYGLLLGLILMARFIRAWVIRRRAIGVAYPGGRIVQIQPGSTILEASRIGGIPHAAVCGGRGRCSTCRVRVLAGAELLSPPSEAERKVLARVGAAPGTRLACQARPSGMVKIVPLLPPTASPAQARARGDFHSGKEQEIAVLFADLRDFTRFSERRLPYDVVFLLNRYFRAMGEAVLAAGGHLDKFIGDGVMALFGVEGNENAAAQALDAARRMAQNLAELNASFGDELKTPLRIGIGIHYGPAIVGEMGFGTAQSLTAVGDTVNTASRLETATKELGVQLVISDALARAANLPESIGAGCEIAIRGRREPLHVLAIADAATIEA